MEPTPYWVLIREMKNSYNHRLRLVQYARQNGLKAAAHAFQTTRRTVRKWVQRYQHAGPSGLLARSRADPQVTAKVSTQARPGGSQSHLASLSATLG